MDCTVLIKECLLFDLFMSQINEDEHTKRPDVVQWDGHTAR